MTKQTSFNTLVIACLLAFTSGLSFAASPVTNYQYDANGNRTKVTDALNHATINAYDARNRLTKITDPNTGQTQYGYNALDQLTQITDPRNLVTAYTIDGLGNLNQQASPDTGTTVNTYDAAGNILTRTDAKGQTTTYSYDALNRLIHIVYADASLVSYQYDQGSNGNGRLTGITDSLGSIAYAYDSHGRVISETRTLNSVAYVISYSYNSVGQLSGITYPSGRVVNYVYNSNNQVSQMTTTVGGTTQTLASNIAYFPFGGVKSFTFGNGANYTRGFDTDGRLASYTLYTQTINLGYDPASRITSATDAANSADTKTYAYDSLDRLTAFTAPTTNQGYGYDATGNRTSLSIGANNYSNTIAPTSNRLTASTGPIPKTFSFDNNGSVTADGINQFSYDARGRLIQAITPAGNVDYGINALGQRVTKTVGTVSTIYHYDLQGHMIAESDAQGTLKQETIYLDNIPLAVMTAHVYYIYTDQLNTPRLITDESNNPVWRWDNSDPFANNPPNDDPNGTGYHFTYNQRYPGQYFDVETNTHYNYYRDHYFPDLGRYGQSDPIGLVGGINTYAYVGGNPVSRVDPSGLLFIDPTGTIPDDVSGPQSGHSSASSVDGTGQVGIAGQLGGWIIGGTCEVGIAVPSTADDACAYMQSCYVLGPQWVGAVGGAISAGQGLPTTGITYSQGGTWFGGTGVVGNGQVTVNTSGQVQGTRGTAKGFSGVGGGAGVGYVKCVQATACLRR